MTKSLTATVIVPTSIDRGPLLKYSVGSVLRQTVSDLEVFIIGDGAHDVTKEAARELERADSRVRFFDHPKGPSRGEIYRHDALQQASGRIVCYLCDRDLYLPDHVEIMAALLAEADFAYTLEVTVEAEGLALGVGYDYADAGERRAAIAADHGLSLSFFGHTLTSYQRENCRWRTTPTGRFTDQFFSLQFVRAPSVRIASSMTPSVLTIRRGIHPGWSTAQRLPEVAAWHARTETMADCVALRAVVLGLVHRERLRGGRLLRRWLLVDGEPLSLTTPRRLLGRLWRRLRRLGRRGQAILARSDRRDKGKPEAQDDSSARRPRRRIKVQGDLNKEFNCD